MRFCIEGNIPLHFIFASFIPIVSGQICSSFYFVMHIILLGLKDKSKTGQSIQSMLKGEKTQRKNNPVMAFDGGL